MKKIGEMLKKEYDAADGVARTILDAVERGSFCSESTCIDGSTRRNVDVKQLGEAVKTLKAVEELKRAITGDVGGESAGVIEIAERE
ncbi:MAG: hypothetical protein J5756_00265 [Clostridia bacterium]|nr:hypothetical protein [Clostridia bacterium]